MLTFRQYKLKILKINLIFCILNEHVLTLNYKGVRIKKRVTIVVVFSLLEIHN